MKTSVTFHVCAQGLVCRHTNTHALYLPKFLLAAVAMFGAISQTRAQCYVNSAAVGLGDGTSWPNAVTDLQTALSNSVCTEIWVAKGVYKPTPATNPNPNISFDITPGIAVYGGFGGGEELRDQRDPAANLTVLSGDIDGNDANAGTTQIDVTPADIHGNNSYHVVVMDGTTALGKITASTVLDGFTVIGGNDQNGTGGGLYCNGVGLGSACSPTLSNLLFTGNSADEGGAVSSDGGSGGHSDPALSNVVFRGNSAQVGGAMLNTGTSRPTLTQVEFLDNSAANGGGAMYDAGYGADASPVLTNVIFRNNRAGTSGGAIFDNATANIVAGGAVDGSSSPELTNVLFDRNTANFDGGAVYNYADQGLADPSFTNVTFSGNHAGSHGGAMSSNGNDSGVSNPRIANVTFHGNTANQGGALYSSGTSAGVSQSLLRNVILWDDAAAMSDPEIANDNATSDIDHSIVQGGCPVGNTCTNPVTGDPFLGKLGNYGGFTATLRPDIGSAAIDSGDNSNCPPADQRGFARSDGHCDIGAVERQSQEDVIFADSFEPL